MGGKHRPGPTARVPSQGSRVGGSTAVERKSARLERIGERLGQRSRRFRQTARASHATPRPAAAKSSASLNGATPGGRGAADPCRSSRREQDVAEERQRQVEVRFSLRSALPCGDSLARRNSAARARVSGQRAKKRRMVEADREASASANLPQVVTTCSSPAAPGAGYKEKPRSFRSTVSQGGTVRALLHAFAAFLSSSGCADFWSKNCSSSVECLSAVVDDWLPCTVVVTASK